MNPFMLFLWAARALPQEEIVGESSVNNLETRRFGFFLALGQNFSRPQGLKAEF